MTYKKIIKEIKNIFKCDEESVIYHQDGLLLAGNLTRVLEIHTPFKNFTCQYNFENLPYQKLKYKVRWLKNAWQRFYNNALITEYEKCKLKKLEIPAKVENWLKYLTQISRTKIEIGFKPRDVMLDPVQNQFLSNSYIEISSIETTKTLYFITGTYRSMPFRYLVVVQYVKE